MKYWANFLPAPIEFREFFDNHRSSCLTLSERQDNPLRVFCPKLPAFSWYQDVKRFLLILMISVHCHEDWYWLSCWPATFSQLKLSKCWLPSNQFIFHLLCSFLTIKVWRILSYDNFTAHIINSGLPSLWLQRSDLKTICGIFFSFIFAGGGGGFFKQCVGYSGR